MTTTTTDDVVSPGTSLVALVPDYDLCKGGNQKSLLRLGAYDPVDEANIFGAAALTSWTASDGTIIKDKLGGGTPYPGWLEYTDGDRTVVTMGANREAIVGPSDTYIQGNATLEITGTSTTTIVGQKTDNIGGRYRVNVGTGGAGTMEVWNSDPVYFIDFFQQPGLITAGKPAYRKREMGHVAADSYWFGDTETFFGGYKFDAMFGMTNTIFVGGKFDFSVAASLSMSFGYAIELGASLKYSNCLGATIGVANDHEIKGRKTIHLRIKPTHDAAAEMTVRQKFAVASAVGGTVIAAALAAGTAAGTVDAEGKAAAPGICLGLGAGVFAAGLAISLILALKEKASPKLSVSEVKMDADGVSIAHKDAAGVVMQSEVYAGEGAAGPGLVYMENVHGSLVHLDPNQDVIVQTAKDLYLQTAGRNAAIQLLGTGQIQMKSTTANIEGTVINLGGNGELRIG